MALHSQVYCAADVPLRNCSLTESTKPLSLWPTHAEIHVNVSMT